MPDDKSSQATAHGTPVLSKEEARARRKRLLAAMERADRDGDASDSATDPEASDSAGATLATMILPGD